MVKTKWNTMGVRLLLLFVACVMSALLLYAPHAVSTSNIDVLPSTLLSEINLNGFKIGQALAQEDIDYYYKSRIRVKDGFISSLYYEAPHLLMEKVSNPLRVKLYDGYRGMGPSYSSIKKDLGSNYHTIIGGRRDEILYIDRENGLMLRLWHDGENTFAILQGLDVDIIVKPSGQSNSVLLNLSFYPMSFQRDILQGRVAALEIYIAFAIVTFLFCFPVMLLTTAPKGQRKRYLPWLALPVLITVWSMVCNILFFMAEMGR